jgi:cystathionine beta-lyase
MNFDEKIDRYKTNSLKYDFKSDKHKPDDVFPMWVADMDFKCCEEILNDMHKKINHGIFGYSKNDETYFNAIKNWYNQNHNVELNQEWLITTPGIVFALATAVKTLTEENDYVLINNPVYYPFTEVVEDNNRKIISSDLVLKDNHYEIDFEDFENKIRQNNVKLFLLCSPHNPVGRVWNKNELDKIIKICKKYNVFIVSDEIHSDFVWNGIHTCLLKYKDYQNNIILCTAPTKTFNLAGLQVSNIFIPNEKIRNKFQLELWNTGYSLINIMGLVACQSAYENGQEWLNELRKYLLENIKYVDIFLKERLPKIKLIYPDGTYLLWLDFNELNLSDDKIEELMLNEAKIWLDNGKMFGDIGKGFQRLNIALPKEKLEWAMKQLENTFKKY